MRHLLVRKLQVPLLQPQALHTPGALIFTTDYDDVSANEKRQLIDADEFAEHLRRDLPRQIRQELEDQVEKEFGPVEAETRSRLADIVQNVSQRVFESWRNSSTKTTTASSAGMFAETAITGGNFVDLSAVTQASNDTDAGILRTPNNTAGWCETEALDCVPVADSQTFDFGDMVDFHLLGTYDYHPVDDKLTDDLFRPDMCDSAYGSYPPLSEQGSLSTWETAARATSQSATEDRKAGKRRSE